MHAWDLTGEFAAHRAPEDFVLLGVTGVASAWAAAAPLTVWVSGDGVVSTWDPLTGEPLSTFATAPRKKEPRATFGVACAVLAGRPAALTISWDGPIAGPGARRRTGCLEAWDLLTGKIIGRHKVPADVAAITAGPVDGRWVVATADSSGVQMWRAGGKSRDRRWPAGRFPAGGLQPAGSWVIEQPYDGLTPALALVPGGTEFLLAVAYGSAVALYQPDGREVARVELEAPTTSIAFEPPESLVVATELGLITLRLSVPFSGRRAAPPGR